MTSPGKIAGIGVLVGAPLLALLLWLASGREIFTHARKVVAVVVEDPLFGDTHTEQQLIPGPILGYFVGADVLIGTCLAALVGAGVWRWRTRQRSSTPGLTQGAIHGA